MTEPIPVRLVIDFPEFTKKQIIFGILFAIVFYALAFGIAFLLLWLGGHI